MNDSNADLLFLRTVRSLGLARNALMNLGMISQANRDIVMDVTENILKIMRGECDGTLEKDWLETLPREKP
jgi:hypothetical protein